MKVENWLKKCFKEEIWLGNKLNKRIKDKDEW